MALTSNELTAYIRATKFYRDTINHENYIRPWTIPAGNTLGGDPKRLSWKLEARRSLYHPPGRISPTFDIYAYRINKPQNGRLTPVVKELFLTSSDQMWRVWFVVLVLGLVVIILFQN